VFFRRSIPQRLKAAVDFAAVTARVELVPFQNRRESEFFRNLLVGNLVFRACHEILTVNSSDFILTSHPPLIRAPVLNRLFDLRRGELLIQRPRRQRREFLV